MAKGWSPKPKQTPKTNRRARHGASVSELPEKVHLCQGVRKKADFKNTGPLSQTREGLFKTHPLAPSDLTPLSSSLAERLTVHSLGPDADPRHVTALPLQEGAVSSEASRAGSGPARRLGAARFLEVALAWEGF